jgi:hypothetical protein
MDLTFLGHQGWMISSDGTNILLDPVLESNFGHSEGTDFRVYPARSIDIDSMPRIDGIFLSHEHLDHFHLPSLSKLLSRPPFFVGPTMPQCVIDAISRLGFSVQRRLYFEVIKVGRLQVTFYPGDVQTVFWEKRVTAFYIKDRERSVFVAVDAEIGSEFRFDLAEGRLAVPDAVIVSNNSQIVPSKGFGSRSNLLPIHQPLERGFGGVRLLNEILVRHLEGLPPIKNVVICGNGFVNYRKPYGPFLFSDNKSLANLANELSIDQTAFGPYSGEVISLVKEGVRTSHANWIVLDIAENRRLLEQQDAFCSAPFQHTLTPTLGTFSSSSEYNAACSVVLEELKVLARAIMVSPVGQIAASLREHLAGPLGGERIVFSFLTGQDQFPALFYGLDINTASFCRIEKLDEKALEIYPFGLMVYLKDFAGMLNGKLQIWDLAADSCRHWFVSDPYTNLISFLFSYYGEQVRPDLASKLYGKALKRLGYA